MKVGYARGAMSNVNPINGVPFGKERTSADCLARAAWEYDQASALRAARKPLGFEALVEGHEKAAKDYEWLAKERAGTSSASAATAHARVRTTSDEFVVQGNYGHGHGWEDLTASDVRKEAVANLREYRANEGVPFRLITRRVKKARPPTTHARKRSVHSTRSDRAAQLLARYQPWTSGYSNEDQDRYQSLANALTAIDREEGGEAPPVGYSKRRYAEAKRVVDDANNYSVHQQSRRGKTSTHARVRQTPFHLYSSSGFEQGYGTLAAATKAAKSAAKRTGQPRRVYRTSAFGTTGKGHGALVFETAGSGAHARKKKLTPQDAKRLLQSEGVDFSRDYHAGVSMSEGSRIAEVAKLAGYKKSKTAPGSTARMYFQYLSRLK